MEVESLNAVTLLSLSQEASAARDPGALAREDHGWRYWSSKPKVVPLPQTPKGCLRGGPKGTWASGVTVTEQTKRA